MSLTHRQRLIREKTGVDPRQRAWFLAYRSGWSFADIGRDLGVNPSTAWRWATEYDAAHGAAEPQPTPTPDTRLEAAS